MRKYEIAHLTSSHDIVTLQRVAPALPAFEDAFSVFGRGAILHTDTGQVAVEDLLPGDRVMTASGAYQTLLWHGSTTIIPGEQNARPEMGTMTRITADALGLARPALDIVFGPAARISHRGPGVRTLTGSDSAFVPVRDFIDQNQIIELTPSAPVQVYQLGFAGHEKIRVHGLEVESLHPGPLHQLGLRGDALALYLSLFPQHRSLDDFGLMMQPRLRLRDLDLFDVA